MIPFILILTLLLSLSACGQNKDEKASVEVKSSTVQEYTDSNSDGAKILVAYFSQTGHTRPLAEHAAEILHADLYEIKAADPYTEADINYGDSESRTSKEQNDPDVRPEIAGSVENMEQYDIVFLGYPIWWGDMPMAVYTFMESYDWSGKVVIPFCTHEGSGLSGTDSSIASVTGAQVLTAIDMRGSTAQKLNDDTKQTVRTWLDDLGF